MKISPSGNKIAYFQNNKGKYALVHKNLSADAKQHAFGLAKGTIREFMWISDNRIALTMSIPIYSPGDYEQFTIWRVNLLDLETNELIDPFDSISYKYNIGASKIVSVLPKDPLHILMSNYIGNKFSLFKVNILNGEKERIESKNRDTIRLVNTNGETLLYRVHSKKYDKRISMYKSIDDDGYKPLMIKTKDGEEVFSHCINGFDSEEKYIYFVNKNKQNFKAGYRAEIIDGYVENIKLVAQGKDIDIDFFVEDSLGSNLILGAHFTDDHSFTQYFDKTLAQIQADLSATFPNASIYITSYDVNKKKFIVEVSGAIYGIEYYLYDTKLGAITLLVNAYPKHKAPIISNVKRFDFVASDDTELKAYLTLPTSKGLPPLIVLPHGGPEQRDHLAFDWIRQFFAANGFAVLQVNFRGSSGYGEDFINTGYGEWGKKMQTDLDDGVAALLAENLVDKSKICIVGASYGGYAALIGATKNPKLYKCAVSYAGVSHLEDVYYHQREQLGSDEYWIKSIGDRFDKEALKNNSPVNLVNKNTAPTLLIHGDKDTVVPDRQSRRMYKALKKVNHKHNKFMIVEGADHWFTEGSSRALFLDESYKFISKYLEL